MIASIICAFVGSRGKKTVCKSRASKAAVQTLCKPNSPRNLCKPCAKILACRGAWLACGASRYANGTMTDLGTLGGSASTAIGINAAGQIVGNSLTTSNAAAHAFLYSGTTMTDLGTVGKSSDSRAAGISDSGQAVAVAFTATDLLGFPDILASPFEHAGGSLFLYSNGTATVPSMAPLTTVYPTAVSPAGGVAGCATIGSGPFGSGFYANSSHGPFLYGNGTVSTFGVDPGLGGSIATTRRWHQLRRRGGGRGRAHLGVGVRLRLFQRNDDRSELADRPELGLGVESAQAINDDGWIAGTGVNIAENAKWGYLLRPAIPGDANLDGRVDINDLTLVLSNLGQTGASWLTGDFTGDGTVNLNDLTIVLANLGQSLGSSAPKPTAVPEPAAGFLLIAAAAVLTLRRGRKTRIEGIRMAMTHISSPRPRPALCRGAERSWSDDGRRWPAEHHGCIRTQSRNARTRAVSLSVPIAQSTRSSLPGGRPGKAALVRRS